jgi:hypothetical protein
VLELVKCVENIASLLSSLRQWLEDGDEDEKWWQLQTQVAQLCLSELELLVGTEGAQALKWVVPTVREMVEAMSSRNRPVALTAGRQALDQLLNLE